MTLPAYGTIALVHPPLRRPSAEPRVLSRAETVLRGRGHRIEVHDANLAFFRTQVGGMLPCFPGTPEPGDPASGSLEASLAILRSEGFYEPARCVRALQELRRALAGLSPRDQIRWGGFWSPEVRNWGQALAFAGDAERNPLLAPCRAWMASRPDGGDLDGVVVLVSSKGQLIGALTWAAEIRGAWPRIPVVLAGDPRWCGGAAAGAPGRDAGITVVDLREFLEPVPVASQGTAEVANAPVEISSASYLAPTRLVAVADLDPSPSAVLRELRHVTAAGAGSIFLQTTLGADAITAVVEEQLGREPRPSLGITMHVHAAPQVDAAQAYAAGVRLVRWRSSRSKADALLSALYPYATAGIWNQVAVSGVAAEVETLQAIAANPHIVHSWSVDDVGRSPFTPPLGESVAAVGTYGQVAPLPGSALWQGLDDPGYLLLYVARHGTRRLSRWRVRESSEEVYTIGEDLDYRFMPPAELPEGYLDEICRMVEAGGAVDTSLVRYNLERAYLIAYALEDGVIVGDSSLKRPRAEYVERVRERTGLEIGGFLERGYTSVRPEYRGLGIGTKLLEGLTARAQGRRIYSIIREDDLATQKIALRNRTEKIAVFYSEAAGKEVGLWMPAGTWDDRLRSPAAARGAGKPQG